MSVSISEREALWDKFLQRWPLEKLNQITLPEYTKAGDSDCFTYGWLEQTTENLGSIWGGSAFKFGVYSRKDKSDKKDGAGKSYSTEYGWYSKYGTTPEAAFERVRAIIVEIANAARSGSLDTIENADLGAAIKWKIAFLYQDRSVPTILPVYKAALLAAYLDERSNISFVQLQKKAMAKRGNNDVLTHGVNVWTQAEVMLSELTLKPEEALKFFQDNPERFQPNKPPTQKIAGFTNADGRSLAVSLEQKEAKLWLEPGKWLEAVKGQLKDIEDYSPDRTRSSNLTANAPALDRGNPALFLTVPTHAALLALCDAYDNADTYESIFMPTDSPQPLFVKTPLNQILYGPPGTGKTYSTIDTALEIIDPAFLVRHPEIPNADSATISERRKVLKRRFDELSAEGWIRFVTFHQSFSYEDFVEGIRAMPADEENGGIQYQVEKGIFAQLCEDARRDKIYEKHVGVRENAKVWKISIEEANSSGETRRYCFDHGEARIGWSHVKDIRKADLTDPVLKLGSHDQSSLANFGRDIVPGDVLVCLRTAFEICAVGIVTGEYEYTGQVPEGVRKDYVHKLPVKWLATDLKFDITALNQGRLVQKTVYFLKRIKWPALQESLRVAKIDLADKVSIPKASTDPYVLIIDEINRGNVSRIFGELITLIEPSKRANAEEALEILLPYSKLPFSVPKNLYLIGTMNTADRSLSGLDIALRRRFTFKEMPPRPDLLENVLIEAQLDIGKLLLKMNERIEVLLDRDHCLGHAYFMPLKDNPTLENLAFIFSQQILPLLQEYFFEDWERISWVLNDHRKFDDFQFISKQPINTEHLFGGEVNIGNQKTVYRLNNKAFDHIQSYVGILDHQKVQNGNHEKMPS
jgi:5-methylcytosine-specific restriction protein B